MNHSVNSPLSRTFYALTIFCIVITIIVLGKPLLAPIALSFVLAFMIAPLVRGMESFGIGRLTSVLVTIVSLTTGFIVLKAQLLLQLSSLAIGLPQHRDEIEAKLATFRTGPDSMITLLLGLLKNVHGNFELLSKTEAASAVKQVTIIDEKSPIPWIKKIKAGYPVRAILKTVPAALESTDDAYVNVRNQKVFGISLGGDRTNAALRAIEIACPKLELSISHLMNASSKRISARDFSIVIFSSLPTNPWELIESFSRRFRRDGFSGWIAFGDWRVKSIDRGVRRRLNVAGADYATHRLHSLCRIVNFNNEFSNVSTPDGSELVGTHGERQGVVERSHLQNQDDQISSIKTN